MSEVEPAKLYGRPLPTLLSSLFGAAQAAIAAKLAVWNWLGSSAAFTGQPVIDRLLAAVFAVAALIFAIDVLRTLVRVLLRRPVVELTTTGVRWESIYGMREIGFSAIDRIEFHHVLQWWSVTLSERRTIRIGAPIDGRDALADFGAAINRTLAAPVRVSFAFETQRHDAKESAAKT